MKTFFVYMMSDCIQSLLSIGVTSSLARRVCTAKGRVAGSPRQSRNPPRSAPGEEAKLRSRQPTPSMILRRRREIRGREHVLRIGHAGLRTIGAIILVDLRPDVRLLFVLLPQAHQIELGQRDLRTH